MSVQVIALGRHEQQAGCEEKLVAKTCTKCGAPLQFNKCEYCGTEYRMSDDEGGGNDGRKMPKMRWER